MHIGPKHRQPASLSPGYMGATEPDHSRWRYRVWHAATSLASPAVKYSFKTSLSIALVGLISFHKSASEVFRVWRGLWALITVRERRPPAWSGAQRRLALTSARPPPPLPAQSLRRACRRSRS